MKSKLSEKIILFWFNNTAYNYLAKADGSEGILVPKLLKDATYRLGSTE
jgi:hypothetical protein